MEGVRKVEPQTRVPNEYGINDTEVLKHLVFLPELGIVLLVEGVDAFAL